MSQRSALIIGAGPVGLIMAGALSKKLAVTLVTKRSSDQSRSIEISETPPLLFGKAIVNCATAAILPDLRADWILICVKAYDLATELSELTPHTKSGSKIMICSNGLGLYQSARSRLGAEAKIFRLLLNFGVRLGIGGEVVRSGEPRTSLGAEDPGNLATREIFETLSSVGFVLSAPISATRAEWIKALTNACVNTICTLENRENGALITDARLNHLALQVLAEVRGCAAAAGEDLSSISDQQILDGIALHGANINSTLEGFRLGKRSELPYLVGEIIALANQRGVRIPILEKLCRATSEMISER